MLAEGHELSVGLAERSTVAPMDQAGEQSHFASGATDLHLDHRERLAGKQSEKSSPAELTPLAAAELSDELLWATYLPSGSCQTADFSAGYRQTCTGWREECRFSTSGSAREGRFNVAPLHQGLKHGGLPVRILCHAASPST